MSVRLILWMLVMAWVGFFIAGKGSYLPLGVTVSGAVTATGIGLLLGFMFSRRENEPRNKVVVGLESTGRFSLSHRRDDDALE